MNTDKDEMRAEYRREDLGKSVRGKYAIRYAKGTNLALLKNLSLLHKTLPQTVSVIDALREDARY
jgi:hypothetical protein